MADTKISALADLTTLADADRVGIADASAVDATLSCTLATLRSYFQSVGGLPYIKRLGITASTASATMSEATDFRVSLPSGRFRFDYWLQVASTALTNSFKFAVDHSGTTSSFAYVMQMLGNSDLAAVGAWDQEVNATTGFVLSCFATRVKNTTLGPGTGIDTTNSNLYVRIGGMFHATTSGDLKLMFGSEVGGNSMSVHSSSTLVLYTATTT